LSFTHQHASPNTCKHIHNNENEQSLCNELIISVLMLLLQHTTTKSNIFSSCVMTFDQKTCKNQFALIFM